MLFCSANGNMVHGYIHTYILIVTVHTFPTPVINILFSFVKWLPLSLSLCHQLSISGENYGPISVTNLKVHFRSTSLGVWKSE